MIENLSMRYLLAQENVALLGQLAWANVLLAFDFDGTLAPIVAERDDAAMRPRTAELLMEVCSLYPCAVISGRASADVEERLSGAPVKYIVGNHGLERGIGLGEYEAEIREARALLAEALKHESGLDIEDKRYSLAVHYRRSRQKRTARETIHRAVASLGMRMRIVPGKFVVNIVPENAPNKGDALVALRDEAGADIAMYVGDDVTDEDVFRLDQPGRLFSVRIGETRASAARYHLRQQGEMDTLLAHLVALRAAGA